MPKPTPKKRKGAARMADIPPDILAQLSAGTIETLTLPEWLAVDHKTLIRTLVPSISDDLLAPLAMGNSIMARSRHAGLALLELCGPSAVQRFQSHPSDTVRGWVCFTLAALPNQSLKQRLKAFTPFADDPHFGVREIAWIALRPHIATNLDASIPLLARWTSDESENIRRFASEITRPRGVWCSHIQTLKSNPDLALPILEPLHSDPSRYVQNSVANWLNDASKTRPDFTRDTASRWAKSSQTPATAYIIKRATRGLTRHIK